MAFKKQYVAIICSLLLSSYFSVAAAERTCKPFVFAYDSYLNFPTTDPSWQRFFKSHCIELKPYTNIDQLLIDLKKHTINAAFMPAGTYYYLKQDSYYQGIASAVLPDHQLTETAYLLVRKNSKITKLEQLKQHNLGFINHECTTSFFATIIYLSQYQLNLKSFFKALIPVPGFTAQVAAISSETAVDAVMLWDQYLINNKMLQQNTRIIGKVSDLPTPVVIVSQKTDEHFKTIFMHQFLNYESHNPTWLYRGFLPYQSKINARFWKKLGDYRVNI